MKDFLKQREKMLQEARLREGIDASDRRTGKSTGMALGFIGQAMMSPEVPIKVYDHNPDPRAADHMMALCWELIEKLGLQGFWGNGPQKMIVYSLKPEAFKNWRQHGSRS